MRVAIIGANGQLGRALCAAVVARGWGLLPILHDKHDVRYAAAWLPPMLPECDVLVNTAAYHDLAKCEREPGTATAVNGFAPGFMARLCAEVGVPFVHISTDYVFDGKAQEPYCEDDACCPLQTYGVSKLVGECLVRNTGGKSLIVRTSGLYGRGGCRAKGGRNFPLMVQEAAREGRPLAVVNDQVTTPSYAPDVAGAICACIERGVTGTVHITNAGECSWYEFACAVAREAGLDATITATTTDPHDPIKRPAYSVLAHHALTNAGIHMRHWSAALRGFLSDGAA